MDPRSLRPHQIGLALLLAFAPPAVLASGYRFGTQSAAAEGTANANAAEAADATTLFANPAGLTRLKGTQLSVVLDVVDPTVRFTDAGSFISLPGSGLASRPTSAVGNVQSPADPALVPHLYLSKAWSDSLTLGMGVFVPWGSKLDYDANWGGRYNLQRVELKSIALNPNLAWKASQTLSFAAGFNLQNMQGKLGRAVPYASAYAAGLLSGAAQARAGGAPALALQLQQQAAQVFGDPAYDGYIAVEGKGWGTGFNLAALWDLSDRTRVGLAYRSAVKHTLKGTGDWTQPANLPAQVLAAVTGKPYDGHSALDHNDSAARLSVKTPESWSVHAIHQLTPSVRLMADWTWTRQSELKEVRINFGSTTAPAIIPQQWKDAAKFSLGADWKLSDSLLLRAGYSFDASPVPSATRGAALPDSDRRWTALGLNWKFSDATSLDFSYGKVKLSDAAMDSTDDGAHEQPCNCAFSTVRGNFHTKATIYGLQMNHKF